MKSVSLKAFRRTLGRRAGAKKLRSQGRVPAVIYGRQTQPQNLEVNAKELGDLIHHSASENLLLDLEVNDDPRPKRLALLQELQQHPLSGQLIHVDFHEVAPDEKVTIAVPVETEGEADGVKNSGGVLEHVLFKVRAKGLLKDLPEVITVDVTHLKLGEAIHLGEIKVPAGVELVGDKQIPVIAVSVPRSEEEEAAEAAEAAAAVPGEVEMIKEKKEEGEEGAAPAKPGEKGAAKPGEKAPAKGAAAEKAPAGDKKAAAAGEKKAGGAEKKAPGGERKK